MKHRGGQHWAGQKTWCWGGLWSRLALRGLSWWLGGKQSSCQRRKRKKHSANDRDTGWVIPEDTTCCGATKSVCRNHWNPRALECVLCNKRIHRNWEVLTATEKSAPQLRSPRGLVGPGTPKPWTAAELCTMKVILTKCKVPTRDKGCFRTGGGWCETLTWKNSPFYFLDTMIYSQLPMYLSIHLLFVNVHT